jgi:hypothetical protein
MTTQQPTLTLCELGETTVPGLQSYSPFCLEVHRALGATGLTYASRHGRPNSFRRLNPAAQVPKSLRTPLTAWQARELTLRPALTDWLDRVDAATFPGRARHAAPDGLTAPRGHDMTRPWPSPIPIHARA